MRQDICHISSNIESGGERNLFFAVATNGYFPTCDVEVKGPLEVSSARWNSQKKGYFKRRTAPKRNRPTSQCRRRRMVYPKLSTGLEHLLSPQVPRLSLLPILFHTLKERTI